MIKRPIELEVEYSSQEEKIAKELGLPLPDDIVPVYKKVTFYTIENISLIGEEDDYDDKGKCLISSGGAGLICKESYNEVKRIINESLK